MVISPAETVLFSAIIEEIDWDSRSKQELTEKVILLILHPDLLVCPITNSKIMEHFG